MNVRSGWCTEYGRVKFDVELNSSDLCQLPPDAPMSLTEQVNLLYLQVEDYAALALARQYPEQQKALAAKIRGLRVKKAILLNEIKERGAHAQGG